DLSSIENNSAAGAIMAGENEMSLTENVPQDTTPADDLDYDPYFQETNSLNVENPDQSDSESMSDGADQEDTAKGKSGEQDSKEQETEEVTDGEGTPALSTAMQPALTFSDSDTLVWPVVGNILVNYSMDKTVYFPTLQQYKYNPAIIIQANTGDLITAASAGKVISVFKDPQIGNGITMELGGGYEATYGQLTNILVSEGSYVAAGDVIAEVAAPTKYFSVEGTNVYFKLTKDGKPVNPMTKLN
ncbi:MAG: M23 family metallopeptidase, partial [Lachnospiraceae bacterium]|nr:M23 family metallopeptidase [Lachnospiraceae bacterium]